MKLTKNQKILIKAIAEKLPDQQRAIQSGTFISGEDLLLSGHTHVQGKEIDPEKEYVMDVPMYFECVHSKRMAKLAKKKGFEGLVTYVSRYLDKNKVKSLMDSMRFIWESKNVVA